jgi:formylglycine-generating enzyme required for sulfatase activity
LKRTRSRKEALTAYGTARHWHPSGAGSVNPGLLDLSGNVYEWSLLPPEPGDVSPWSVGVLRGGSWMRPPRECLSQHRLFFALWMGLFDFGFRLCRVSIPPVTPLR